MLKSIAFAMVGMLGPTVPAAADDVRQAIEQVNCHFVEAYRTGDALYTDTAKVLPPDATEIAGQDAIQSFWQSLIDDGLKDLTLEAMEVESSGDLAYEVGQFSLQAPAENDTTAAATGNSVVVWKQR